MKICSRNKTIYNQQNVTDNSIFYSYKTIYNTYYWLYARIENRDSNPFIYIILFFFLSVSCIQLHSLNRTNHVHNSIPLTLKSFNWNNKSESMCSLRSAKLAFSRGFGCCWCCCYSCCNASKPSNKDSQSFHRHILIEI